ncbi:MAG: serine/threonine-protein kinase [Gemmatales bacterium]
MIGEQIGKWTITRKISQGGMADVFLAEAPSNNGKPDKAAIKILRIQDTENADRHLERFHREVDILRSLKHDNIVRLYESGEFRGLPYLVMEFVDGLSLDRVLEQRGKLSWEEVVVIGQMVASALRYAHRQEVIHRDLKPANLLADWDRHVKLTDFGIARLLNEDRLTKENAIVGTASYVSPEQAAGKPATRKSDLYSLGVILYELLTGRLPFEANTAAELLHKHRYAQFESPSRLIEEVPHDFDKLIESLLEKDPDKRPANALAVEDALNKLKRKFDRQKQYTPRPSASPTKVMDLDEAPSEEELAQLRGRLRADRPAFPTQQALLLLGGLAGVIALWLWLRQPASVETLKNQISTLLKENDWSAAQSKYDLLVKHHAGSVPKEERDELQADINNIKTYTQAKIVSGPYTFVPPSSDAERFYRRGVLAYYSGQVEEARTIWKNIVATFKDIPVYSAWVRLAEEALKQSDSLATFNLDAVIKSFGEMDASTLKARLLDLQKLYQTMPDSEWKTSALKAISEKVKELEKVPGK